MKHLSSSQGLSFEIGSHSLNHLNLSGLDQRAINVEINRCHMELEASFGEKIPYFSFPFGKLHARNYLSDVASRKLNVDIFECYGGVNNIYREHFNVLRIGVHNETKSELLDLLARQWVR